jgi:hypothetical protein
MAVALLVGLAGGVTIGAIWIAAVAAAGWWGRRPYRRVHPADLADAYWRWVSLRSRWGEFHRDDRSRATRRGLRRCNRECRLIATVARQRGIGLGAPTTSERGSGAGGGR